jgi:thymidylate kinase
MTPVELVHQARTVTATPAAVHELADRLGAPAAGGGRSVVLVSLDGVSGAGKDTQIARLVSALERCGRSVSVTSVRGTGTPFEPIIRAALAANLATDGVDRWRTDLVLKLVGWMCTARVASRLEADVVVSNRSGLSAVAYSSATLGDAGLVDAFRGSILAPPSQCRWVPIVLTVPPAEAVPRTWARGRRSRLPLRPVDALSFVRKAADAFAVLADAPPAVGVDGVGSPVSVHGRVLAAASGALRDQLG